MHKVLIIEDNPDVWENLSEILASVLTDFYDRGQGQIHLLRKDLAAIAGTAKETLIRTLTDFKNEKLVEIRDGAIVVMQAEKLRNLPN